MVQVATAWCDFAQGSKGFAAHRQEIVALGVTCILHRHRLLCNRPLLVKALGLEIFPDHLVPNLLKTSNKNYTQAAA